MISVVVPCSPIASNPGTAILEQTLDSVRHHLPDAQLFVTFDGVRSEQKDMRDAYEQFIFNALWLLDHHYGNAYPVIFDEHMHQSGMLRSVIETIETPLLMYVEADCPIVTDELIAWPAITEFLESGESNLIRLHHETHVLDAHQHMCHGTDHGDLFTRTSQWSQRPHIASVAFYRRLLDSYFRSDSKAFLEDRLHGVVAEAFNIDGMAGWNQFRLHLYTPSGSIKRSYTLDGRAGGPKFDDSQTW